MYIILAIIALYILIVIYEFGHLISAKLNKVKVEEFSIGVGPTIISKKIKETSYKLKILPIGGYIKMLGECDSIEGQSSFFFKSFVRKISIILSGILMTLIVLLISNICTIYTDGYKLTTIKNSSISQNSGNAFLKGDKILKVNNIDVRFGEDVIYQIALSGKEEVDFLIDKAGEKKSISINRKDEENLSEINSYLEQRDNPTILESIKIGFNKTTKLISETYRQFGRMITKDINLRTYITGLFEVVENSTETINIGFNSFFNTLFYMGIVFISFNLLPLPIFDGGKCFIEVFQVVTKIEISRKIIIVLDFISLIAILGLIIFILI